MSHCKGPWLGAVEISLFSSGTGCRAHALAGAYHADGQTKKAVDLLEHVVAVKSVVYRKDHPLRLVSESVLNYLLAEQLDNLHMPELQKDGI